MKEIWGWTIGSEKWFKHVSYIIFDEPYWHNNKKKKSTYLKKNITFILAISSNIRFTDIKQYLIMSCSRTICIFLSFWWYDFFSIWQLSQGFIISDDLRGQFNLYIGNYYSLQTIGITQRLCNALPIPSWQSAVESMILTRMHTKYEPSINTGTSP